MERENIYVSFGENCLPDDILKRYDLKSFSTPYSSGRSNVEYILQIESDQFSDFLNRAYMRYEPFGDGQMLRLKHYDQLANKYNSLCMNGFEFTHHNVFSDEKQRERFERRCNRLLNLRDKNLFIFYHHRYCEDTDMNMLLRHLSQLRDIYLKRCPYVEIIMFTQAIVDTAEYRRVEHRYLKGIHVYTFYTMDLWSGQDGNIFWARCDDDLIKTMIDDVRNRSPFSIAIKSLLFRIQRKTAGKAETPGLQIGFEE